MQTMCIRDRDKIMADLGGEPLLVRTVRAFQETAVVKQIVIVTRPNLIGPVSAACEAAGFSLSLIHI